jgi:hypothetical protein
MSTDFPYLPTDAQLLHDYLGRRIEDDAVDLSAAEIVAELSDYGAQLHQLRKMVSEADASLDAGLAKPLDVEALLARVRQRAAAQGRTG